MRMVKVQKEPPRKTDWAVLFSAFLATGERAMELVDWQTNHKTAKSAYLTAYMATQVNGFDKAVRVSFQKGRIYLVRKDGNNDAE